MHRHAVLDLLRHPNAAVVFNRPTFESKPLKFNPLQYDIVRCCYCSCARGAFFMNPDIEGTWVCSDCHELIQSLDPDDPLLDLGGEG